VHEAKPGQAFELVDIQLNKGTGEFFYTIYQFIPLMLVV
jgi:hypothetical protein